MKLSNGFIPKRIRAIRGIAKTYEYREVLHNEEVGHLRFKKGIDTFVDVWYTKMTVGTVLTHPIKGRGVLFRKNADETLLKKIFRNPRQHTGEGYYKKT